MPKSRYSHRDQRLCTLANQHLTVAASAALQGSRLVHTAAEQFGCWQFETAPKCERLRNKRLAIVKFHRVHVREIVVIPGIDGLPDQPGMSPGRLPFGCRVDISAATPLSAFQGRDHGD
jgi:hypothetical protein